MVHASSSRRSGGDPTTASARPAPRERVPRGPGEALDVVVLCTRDPGGRATGRVVVLRSHLRALEALGHSVRVVVVSPRPPGQGPWAQRFWTTHVPTPGVVSVARSAARVLVRAAGVGGSGVRASSASTLNEALFVDSGVRRAVAAAAAGADVVVADGLRLSSAADLLEGTPVVVDLDDLLSDRYLRMRSALRGRPGGRADVLGIAADRVPRPLRRLAGAAVVALLRVEARCAGARERTVTASAATVSLVSREEVAVLSERCARPVAWLPPTVDVPAAPVGPGEGLVFLGGLDYRPNVEAVRFWRDAVVPHLRASGPVPPLHVVGHCPDEVRAQLEGPDVVMEGFVDDLGSALRRRALVAPLLDQGGVKVKVLDALALGLPVVGTPAAFEGTGLPEALRWGSADPEALACAVRALLDDDELRDRLASGGRVYAAATFSHEAGARRWAEVLRGALAPVVRTGGAGARSASLR